MPRQEIADIAAGRLSTEQLADNFSDVAPPLDRQRPTSLRAAASQRTPSTMRRNGAKYDAFLSRVRSHNGSWISMTSYPAARAAAA